MVVVIAILSVSVEVSDGHQHLTIRNSPYAAAVPDDKGEIGDRTYHSRDTLRIPVDLLHRALSEEDWTGVACNLDPVFQHSPRIGQIHTVQEITHRKALVELRQTLHGGFEFALSAEYEGQQEGLSNRVIEQDPEFLQQFGAICQQLTFVQYEYAALTLFIHFDQGFPELQEGLDLLPSRLTQTELTQYLPQYLVGCQGRMIYENQPVILFGGTAQILLQTPQNARFAIPGIFAYHQRSALVAGDCVLKTKHAFPVLFGEIEHIGIGSEREGCPAESPEIKVALTQTRLHCHCPVEPKPPAPRNVAGSSSDSLNVTCITGEITIWAIRIPCSTVKDSFP